jgi:hypothetical protein
VKQFAYDESVETWVDLFLFLFISTNEEVVRKRSIVDNMILNLLYDLRHELALMAPAR